MDVFILIAIFVAGYLLGSDRGEWKVKTEEEIKARIKILKIYASKCYENAEQRSEFENAICAKGKITALEWVLEE